MRKWLCVLILSWLPFLAGAAEPAWTEPAADGVQVSPIGKRWFQCS